MNLFLCNKAYYMNDRKHIQVSKKKINDTDDGFVNDSPDKLFQMVWDITLDTWAFLGETDAEQRLQRNVTNIIRRRC